MARYAPILSLLVCVAALAGAPAHAADRGQARVIVDVETLPPPGEAPVARDARLYVTGTGLPPRRAVGTAQGRLLARRAAMVDGYRKIANATNRWRVEAGGRERYNPSNTTAFVRGARLERERYFSDGRVEVDVSAPPPEAVPPPNTPEQWRRFQETAARAGMLVVTAPQPRADRQEISREEWEQWFATRQSDPSQ